MSAGYYRVGQYYIDDSNPSSPILWRCTGAGDKTTSTWAKVSGGGANTDFFQIVSDAGDWWVCNLYGGAATAFYNVAKPYNIRAGANAIASQVINNITFTYTYTPIYDLATGLIVLTYKRKASGSDGSVLYDYIVPPPIGNDNTQTIASNDLITALEQTDDVAACSPDSVIAATINAGGTGYAIGNVLTLVGGTGTPATLKVTTVASGVITGVQMVTGGAYTVTPLSSGCAVTGGAGTGATFNLQFGGRWLDINRAGRAWTWSPYN